MPEDEVEELVVEASGDFPVVWTAMEDHHIYYGPWYEQYEEGRQYERYWGATHGYEKVRYKQAKKEKYWENPERARIVSRQKFRKHYYSSDPDLKKQYERERKRAYRAKQRAEKEAKKNEN